MKIIYFLQKKFTCPVSLTLRSEADDCEMSLVVSTVLSGDCCWCEVVVAAEGWGRSLSGLRVTGFPFHRRIRLCCTGNQVWSLIQSLSTNSPLEKKPFAWRDKINSWKKRNCHTQGIFNLPLNPSLLDRCWQKKAEKMIVARPAPTPEGWTSISTFGCP